MVPDFKKISFTPPNVQINGEFYADKIYPTTGFYYFLNILKDFIFRL